MKCEIIDGKLITDGEPVFKGSLDLNVTGITELPDGLSVGGSLYLDGLEDQIENIGYAKNCGYYSRTIYAVRLNGIIKIAAGRFLDSLERFCEAVDEKYKEQEAENYKQKARDAIAMLEQRMEKSA
jgi:hypothetical protein